MLASLTVLMWLSMVYSFILFHVLVELYSIIIAVVIFILAWNSRRRLDNDFLLFIGIAFLFIAFIDVLHTLAYSGMNVFQGYDTDLPTQLWIAARYLQAVTMLIAPIFIVRRLNTNLVFLAMAAITSTLLVLVFGRWFPECYVVGSGLTSFKIISEYVIIAILFGAVLYLRKNRGSLDDKVYWLIQGSLVFMMASEFFFTQYVSVFGPVIAIGHLLKVVEFFLLYLAIVRTGLSEPFRLLFKGLKESEERIRATLDTAPMLVVGLDQELRIRLVNREVERVMGTKAEFLMGQRVDRLFAPGAGEHITRELLGSNDLQVRTFELPMRALDPSWTVEWRWKHTSDGFLLIGVDVTEGRAAQRRIDEMGENRRVVHKILRHDLKNQLMVISGHLAMYELKGDPKNLENIRTAIKKGDSIIEMTNDLESGLDSSQALEEVDVAKMVKKVLSSLDKGETNIIIEGRLKIMGDAAFSSVLQNLIGNALLHAAPKNITVRMWQDGNGGHLEVIDDGIGISEEVRRRLFEEGVKGNALGSSGMGLYLVRKVVERYGGMVSYRPNQPRGSVFALDLPLS